VSPLACSTLHDRCRHPPARAGAARRAHRAGGGFVKSGCLRERQSGMALARIASREGRRRRGAARRWPRR
jgi:hypothetical protein